MSHDAPAVAPKRPPVRIAALAYLGPKNVRGPRYGYWAFELPRAPKSWLRDAAMMDEVWVPSSFTGASLEGARAPVRTVPVPLFMEDYRDVEPAPRDERFLAVTLFDFKSSMARKNPQGIIAAFRPLTAKNRTIQSKSAPMRMAGSKPPTRS